MGLSSHITLCGHVLSSVQEAKYLGITLTDELSWSSHVRLIHNRANSILGFLRRNRRRCPAKLKETAYITSVRSTLEYAAPVWDPHLARDCDLLEKIQRRSARFVKGDHRTTSSVTQMLHDLGWRDLSAWSSARHQTGLIVQGCHWTCGRWSRPDWLSGCR